MGYWTISVFSHGSEFVSPLKWVLCGHNQVTGSDSNKTSRWQGENRQLICLFFLINDFYVSAYPGPFLPHCQYCLVWPTTRWQVHRLLLLQMANLSACILQYFWAYCSTYCNNMTTKTSKKLNNMKCQFSQLTLNQRTWPWLRLKEKNKTNSNW